MLQAQPGTERNCEKSLPQESGYCRSSWVAPSQQAGSCMTSACRTWQYLAGFMGARRVHQECKIQEGRAMQSQISARFALVACGSRELDQTKFERAPSFDTA
jgi:hypothetical protein